MKKLLLAILLLASTQIFAQQNMNVATYNLRYANKGDSTAGNGWGSRYPVIAQLIRFNDLDVFGTQEVLHHQLLNLTDSLPGYKWIGIGRDDGKTKGEYSAIFYQSDKYTVVKSGTFWMSGTDTEHPNKGWDAQLPRICTWAQLKDKKTGFTFNFFNLHMDHVGIEARRESSKLVVSKIKEMVGTIPTILTGDFNIDQHNESYAVVNDSGLLKDCFVLSPVKLANSPTFNSFKVEGAKGDARIDHIFVSKQFKVNRYGILTHSFGGRVPSDHYPVVVNLSVGK
ncbi:endonuclease/exonuclease/phosphatase family protein [Mucilaginibacter myungsuensis]|uniref:Endonuclease/exonuclease/phosphatase family protein n=1 Tax=Mucilaginibacter myungsuensis TaxID=649104 RepID=A0A929KY97_9SPHI|nr:endonuclease/exonuclease/phosphatase family protein [Mucilaginibacter myungsuensis]MBE9662740.1 endonuclease/exonuclease/phosphatase family protein [Mucilaginibacter myungsuensis]MDN3598160.1 endonuclease/exonuclease/phosphatase family protein [Mucilaginibacter myungsuensis]